jgi:hypothetical protein
MPSSPAGGPSLPDVVAGITAGVVAEGKREIERATGGEGRITIQLVINIQDGEPTWSRGFCSFERRRTYRS